MEQLTWNEGLFSGNILENGVIRQQGRTFQKLWACADAGSQKCASFGGLVGTWNGWGVKWALGHQLGFYCSFNSDLLDCEGLCSVLGVYTHATVVLERWEGLGLVPGMMSPVLKVGTWGLCRLAHLKCPPETPRLQY